MAGGGRGGVRRALAGRCEGVRRAFALPGGEGWGLESDL